VSKQTICLVCLLTTVLLVSSAEAQLKYPKYNPQLTGFYDANDSSSATLVDRMNSYNIMQDILYLTHKIEDDADNRMHFEFHVAGGLNYDWVLDTTGFVAGISVKINLGNPKIPNPSEVINNIHELKNRMAITGFQLPDPTLKNIEAIENHMIRYNRQFWWKRLSFGATVPFNINATYNPPLFKVTETYLFLGYDLGDVMTLQLGANLEKKVFVAASLDLSTPLYSLAEDFKDMLSRLLKIPVRGDRGYSW
jgi:hypothetical protein